MSFFSLIANDQVSNWILSSDWGGIWALPQITENTLASRSCVWIIYWKLDFRVSLSALNRKDLNVWLNALLVIVALATYKWFEAGSCSGKNLSTIPLWVFLPHTAPSRTSFHINCNHSLYESIHILISIIYYGLGWYARKMQQYYTKAHSMPAKSIL